MLVYHGTSEKYLKDILKNGIRPRKQTLKMSNWEKYASILDMVYLTFIYPFYFGLAATKDKVVVFEIELDDLKKDLLYPDEDFVVQACKDLRNHEQYKKNIEVYKRYWLLSLESLGNMCYKGKIPVSAIKRYCVVDFKTRKILEWALLDPMITILNYRYCGDKYRQMVKWFFGDEKELLCERELAAVWPGDFGTKYVEAWKKEAEDRTGITVVNVGHTGKRHHKRVWRSEEDTKLLMHFDGNFEDSSVKSPAPRGHVD